MTVREREKIEELERDVKIMQKELKETFADFEKKKSSGNKVRNFFERLKNRLSRK